MRIGNLSGFLTTKEQIVLIGIACALCVGGITLMVSRAHTPDQPPAAESVAPREVAATVNDPAPLSRPAEPAQAEAVLKQSVVEPLSQPVTVAVTGAVVTPGVYTLPPDARVKDLIEKADGLADDADARDINMAADLIDGSTLTIPAGAHAAVEGNTLVMRGAPTPAATNPPQYTISGWRAGWTQVGASSDETQSPSRVTPSTKSEERSIDINRASQSELETLPGIGPAKAQAIIQYREQQPFRTVDELEEVRGIGPKTLENLRPLVTVDPF